MNIILVGSSGAMGHAIIEQVKKMSDIKIKALVQMENDSEFDYPVFTSFTALSDWEKTHHDAQDVIIDFSSPLLTELLLEFAMTYHLPIMLATTGQTAEQETLIQEASKQIPILNTHNTSIGVNVMQKAVALLTKSLYELGYDIEIIEKHHRYKKDAPSGTAIMLRDAVAHEIDETVTTIDGRSGVGEPRTHHEIGMHAVRGGNIVGEHTVLFANNQETIEITHRAGSKAIFAGGAINAAKFLLTQQSGFFSMDDVI